MNSLCTSLFPHVPFVIYVILFVLPSKKNKKIMNSFSSSPSSSSSERKSIPNLSHHAMEPYSKRTKNYAIEQTFVYDVLVNFYFGDTGKSFCSHLLGALERHGFTVFDHKKLSTGHNECPQLLKAIQESKIYVLVFSVNYAVSERCLDELVDIMDHHKYDQRKVLPVFFNVEPSDVRKQQGPYKEAFEAHETTFDIERVKKWRQALKEAGALSGLHPQNGDEEEFVRKIVEEVEKMQNPQELPVTDHGHPVGISSRVEELISCLRLDSEDVSIVAILGIGGIGKTTIVKATYNRIAAKFDVSCFLEGIHYLCEEPNWRRKLQKLLFSRLAQPDVCQIGPSHSDGVAKIKQLISCRKVLSVLDDVDHIEQLQTVGIRPAYFHPGSRIIVTTRDEQSLSLLEYARYTPTLLDYKESLELSTRLTFGQDDPFDEELLEEIVSYAGGLPLVLEVWSRHFKCYPRELWRSELEKLKRIPHKDVQRKLKLAYDSLDNRDKKLFLDIVCFFDGYEKDYVVKVLQDEDTAFFPDVRIQNLVSKGLIKMGAYISTRDKSHLVMHHAIGDMAREIVHQEHEEEPGQRSRLWDERDVLHVLTECSGTEKVESIKLFYSSKEVVSVRVETLRKLSNLRLLQLRDYYDGGLSWTSSNDDMPPLSFKKLKYLDWLRFPLKSINIDMSNVVVVHLQRSKLEILWEEGMKSLKKLRILDVDRSSSLTKTGNFYGVENLEELSLRGCENLEELDNSIGCLDKLVKLDLRRCRRLRKFPFEVIGKLRSLKILDLSKCRNIGLERDEVIDPFLSSLKECSITELHLAGCNILKISNEIGSLTSLEHLDLRNNGFPSLPDSLGKLCQLEVIDLSQKGFPSLPDSLGKLCQLKKIVLSYRASLKSIPTFLEKLEWRCGGQALVWQNPESARERLMNIPSNASELQGLRQLLGNDNFDSDEDVACDSDEDDACD